MAEGWITVLNEWFDWGNVIDIAMQLSSYLECAILTSACFDDDVFELGVIRDKRLLTSHISGDVLQVYDLVPTLGAIDVFVKELKLEVDMQKLVDILELLDIQEKIEELQNLIEVPIEFMPDWLDDAPEEIKSAFELVQF